MGGWVDGWTDRRMDGWVDRWMDGFGNTTSKRGTVRDNITQKLEILTTYINIIGKVNQARSSLTTRTKEEKLNINICLYLKA